jgi:hypothetical protein
MREGLKWTLIIGYEVAGWGTFGFLTFFDDVHYTWWNWIILLPINGFLGQIWPIYWLILRPLFGR